MSVKIYVNKDFIGNVFGKSVPFHTGDEVVLADEPAEEFVKAGYVTILLETPAVKIVNKPVAKRKSVK